MVITQLIIPCHNESQTISKLIREVQKMNLPLEIIVVDNASTDDTLQIAKELGVKVIIESQVGKGNAMRKAFRYANAPCVAMIDGDCTYDLTILERMIDAVQDGADMAVCERIPVQTSAFPPFHRLGNLFFSQFQKKLFRLDIDDSFSGFRVFSLPFVKSFAGDSQGFDFETELNVHAHITNAKLVNVPGNYFPREAESESKLSTFADGFKILKKTIYLFARWRPFVASLFLIIPFMLVGCVLISRPVIDYLQFQYVFRTPSLITGLTSLVVGSTIFLCAIFFSMLARIEKLVVGNLFSFHQSLAQRLFKG